MKEHAISSGTEKIRPPSHLAHLSIWRGGQGMLDIDTQLNILKKMDLQVIKSNLWKDLMLYRLNLILNSNQGPAFFRQKQIVRSNRHENLQKQNNKDFFIRLRNTWQTHIPNWTFTITGNLS